MTKLKIYKIVAIIFTIIAIISGLITIVLIIIKLTGNSPDLIAISLWVVTTVITLIMGGIYLLFPMKEDIGGMKEFQRQTIVQVNELKEFQRQTMTEVSGLRSLQNKTLSEIDKIKKKLKI